MTRIIYLGGVNEVGMNMTAIETERDIIVIDCGVSFAESNDDEIYYKAPDMTYLLLRKKKVKALFLTHGHEDHIGNIKLFMECFEKADIYGSPFTIRLANHRIVYGTFDTKRLKMIYEGQKTIVGDFKITPMHVNHSIPQAYAYHISTPDGNIIHSGDLKVDLWAENEKKTNLKAFKKYGEEGVDLLLLESTNAEKTGHSISETMVADSLVKIFDKYKRNRIVITLFSTNIGRIKNIIELAAKYERKVYICGENLLDNINAGIVTGAIKGNRNTLLDEDGLYDYLPEQIVIITPGCQGESNSNLYKMATSLSGVTCIDSNDIVVFSSSIIPGNEAAVKKVKDSIFACGAQIIDINDLPVHATGHGCQSDLKMIINSVKPTYFTPIHGELNHLTGNAMLAAACGIPMDNIYIPSNGYILELENHRAFPSQNSFDNGITLLNGERNIKEDNRYFMERQKISSNGLIIVSAAIDYENKVLYEDFMVDFIGISFVSDKFIQMAKDIVAKTIRKDFNSNKPYKKLRYDICSALIEELNLNKNQAIKVYVSNISK